MEWGVDHFRKTWIEVNLEAIASNVRAVRQLHDPDVTVMAVVKADGYGHGAIHVAQAALAAGAKFLGVALLEEALKLRKAGITTPILVLGRVNPSDVRIAARYDIALTAFQTKWLKEAREHLAPQERLKLHIKCDTGMGRIGLTEETALIEFLETIKSEPVFHAEGLFTHLATADEWGTDYLNIQLDRFRSFIKTAEEIIGKIPFIHCGNSAASMRYPKECYTMIRFGISMYGLAPAVDTSSDLPFKLQPAMSLKSTLTHVKKVSAGTAISYGADYRASEDEWIGTLPIGYGDGWLRLNSEAQGEVLVAGMKAPIVGRICMDQMMIKLPKEMPVGTEVTLIGRQGGRRITIEEIAERLGTITYEIPCLLNDRIPRFYS